MILEIFLAIGVAIVIMISVGFAITTHPGLVILSVGLGSLAGMIYLIDGVQGLENLVISSVIILAILLVGSMIENLQKS